jgi:PEP-CTERM motif
MAYDLTQDFSDEFKPSYLIPLDYNINIIPQDSIISIFVSSSDRTGGEWEAAAATLAPEPSTSALMLVGLAGLGLAGHRASGRTAAA